MATRVLTIRRRKRPVAAQVVRRAVQFNALQNYTTDPIGDYEARMGFSVPVDYVGQASARGSWTFIEGYGPQLDAMAALIPPRKLTWTQNVFPNNLLDATGYMSRDQWAAAVSGAYDDHFVTAATRLKAWGFPDAVIRIGHEFNGNWYSWWAAGPGATGSGGLYPNEPGRAYREYFRRIALAFRSVDNRFRICWNAAKGAANMNAELAWPGDDVVDLIGVDFYDTNGTYYFNINNNYRWWEEVDAATALSKRQSSWQNIYDTTNRGMLRWWVDFATNPSAWSAYGRSTVKPLCFPEMGTAVRFSGTGGGDNDIWYTTRITEFVTKASNNFEFVQWFEVDASDGLHRLLGPEFPNSRQVWSSMWAAGPRVKV